MPHSRMLSAFVYQSLAVVVLLGGAIAAQGTANAAILQDAKNLAWASRRDLTDAQFAVAFRNYRRQGYLMIDVDVYPVAGGFRYSMVWRKNTDGRTWAEHHDLTGSQYHEKWTHYKDNGYRPLDIEAYRSGTRFAGIWVENTERVSWLSRRGMTDAEYAELFAAQSEAGYRVVDIEVYPTDDGLRYAAIWYKNTDGRKWLQVRGMTRAQYQEQVDQRGGEGLRVVDFESYQTSNGQRYAAIWEKKPGYAWQTRTNRNQVGYANLWRQYRDEGYRIVDFERYDTPQGPRYAGIWAENAAQFRYGRKAAIDQLVQAYRTANNLPGLSVGIVRNGEVSYRRGFGLADVARGKVAHAETVYVAASVSKTFGGTLAAKLENDQQPRGGRTLPLDLSQPTSKYIQDLPAFHTHKLEQLLSHLSCVAHYPGSTTPGIANQTTHYPTATAAVRSIWNTRLVQRTQAGGDCTVGTTQSYSTHGFTFLAAALEGVTRRPINSLLQDEIFRPYGLASTRVQFAFPTLPSNYDRAVPYDNSNNEIAYTNNSWKVLGGGLESNVVDLARFGWLVLDGKIVSAKVRDGRLWKRVGASRYGLGWLVTTENGRRVAEHTGSVTGARSFLRVYRDDGLVVAIMSNRSNHRVDDVTGLATKIGREVLR